jgi:sugar lactone lactonase YvrE
MCVLYLPSAQSMLHCGKINRQEGKTMKKRILSAVLALALMIALASAAVSGAAHWADELMAGLYEREILTTLAGDGELGRDTGNAIDTRFALPHGLTFDNNGNLIVFDTFNAGVRRISNGQSSTLLGFTAASEDTGFVRPGHLDGAAAIARLGRPTDGVVAPNGDLYIVDSANHAIRLLRGNDVFTFAGGTRGFANGNRSHARFDSPSAIAIDNQGNLYIADTLNHRIRRIDPHGNVTTIAGNGTAGRRDGAAGQAQFNEPSGIAIGANGEIFVADTGNHVIRRIHNGMVSTVSGVYTRPPAGEDYAEGGYADGAALSARFNFPHGLCWVDGVLYIADTGNHAIRALQGGIVSTVAGTGEPGGTDGLPGVGTLNAPMGITYKDGFLYIADTHNHKVRAVWLGMKGWQ